MSRRREAAELARVLLLSTQEATTAARISPHTLSSSDKHATQDSKDMELRPYEPHGRDNLAAARVVMQPTVRPTDVMGPPESLVVLSSSGSGSGARSDQVRGTATNTTSDVPTSAIRSFTPSGSSNRPPLVIPLSLNQPTTFSRTNQHQLSSPPNAPGPSHVFTPDKPTSSGDSSDRPLFSPTQKSSQPGPAVQDPACQPPQVITYGKSSNRVGGGTTPTTARKAHALTSSPAAGPTRAAESWSRGPFTVSSDNEVEEEVKEPNSKPRSTVQVVLPRRDKSIHRPAENRHASPDPLYGLIDNADPASTSARKSLQSRSSVAAEESQVSADGSGPGRRSSRVKENVEKKQAEQEARRKARRERKAREAEEERRRESGEASPENRRKSTTTSREERRKRRSSEVLVLVDETMPSTETTTRTRENRDKSSTPAVPAPTPHTETKDTAPDSRKRKSRFGEDEDELDSWHGSADEGAASPVKKVKAKAKDKKGNGRQKAASRTKPKGSHMVEVLQDEEEAERVDVAHEEKNTMAEDVEDEETTMRVDKAQDGEKTMKRRSEDDVPHEPEPSEQGDADIQTAEQARRIPAAEETPKRSPLESGPSHANTPSHRPSPGPQLPGGSYLKPGGIRWKTPRNDLSAVLQKFNGARQSGMSKRLRIAPLHMKIGPPAKALPPVPVKPVKKKKGEESDEDEVEEGEGAMTEDEEGNMVPKVKKGGKGMDWYMVED